MPRYQVLVDCKNGSQMVGDRWEPVWYTATVTVCDSLEDAERWVSRMSGINPQQRNPRIRTLD